MTAAVAFLANKNGTNQTGVAHATFSPMTFSNEVIDIGDHFASSAWVPPAGYVRIGAQFAATGTMSNAATCQIGIYKNSNLFQLYARFQFSNATECIWTMVDDVANGTDSYEAWCYMEMTSGTGTVLGDITKTMFWGYVFQ